MLKRIFLIGTAAAVLVSQMGAGHFCAAADLSGRWLVSQAGAEHEPAAPQAGSAEQPGVANEKAPGDPEMKNSAQAQGEDKRPYAEAAVKHYNRGVELHQSGFLNQAIAEYRGAIEADSRMEEAYSNLGLIYAAQRNYSKAVDAFNKALVLKPGRPTTLNGLGTVLYARGKVQEAMEKWKQAIATDPNFASAYYNMGNALENEKDYPAALNAYVNALRINPGMADAFYRSGTLLNRDKHTAQANVLLSKAIELAPDADFVRDAKKQLSALEGQFSGGSDEPEVKMNVLPPPSNGSDSAPLPTAGAPAAAAPEEKGAQNDFTFIQPAETK